MSEEETATGTLLSIRNLRTEFSTPRGKVTAVDDVSFDVKENEIVGIIGETGSGKSVTALSILRLLPPAAKTVRGEVIFNGKDLLKASPAEIRQVRGNGISMVFQEPFSYLNPMMRIGDQISEILSIHRKVPDSAMKNRVMELLHQVEMPNSENTYSAYPHQLSGGMQQRVLIAMAIACNPKLVIADEPTTALDVTVQYEILQLLKKLKKEFGLSILLITHDFGVVAELCDRINVMYAGKMIENGPVKEIFHHPIHPYASMLLKASNSIYKAENDIYTIPGNVPSLHRPPSGCRFHPRCPYAIPICIEKEPQQYKRGDHSALCWNPL